MKSSLLLCILFGLQVFGQYRQKTYVGQNVHLKCIPPDIHENDHFSWMYDDKLHIDAKREFSILNVSQSDSGVYECNIVREINGVKKVAKQSVSLQVIQPQSEITTHVQEGQTVRLQCIVGDTRGENISYTWINPDSTVISNTDQALLGSIRLNQAGKYVCQALKTTNGENLYASQATNIVVVPTSKIKFKDLERNTKEVIETGYVHQSCSVNAELGSGDYDYHWNDPLGKRVSNSSILEIKYALKEKHSGTYECVATPTDSSLGTISGQMHLVVKPLRFDITTLQEDTRYGGYSDRKVTISYLPMPATATREKFEYYWYNPVGQKLNDYSTENMRLLLKDINDFGVYTVRVQGQNSDYQTELKMQVLINGNTSPESKSKIVITYEPFNPQLGQNLDLTCNLDPKPSGPYTTRWIKSNGEVVSTSAHLSLRRLKETDIDDLNCEIVHSQTKYTGKVELFLNSLKPTETSTNYRLNIFIEPSRYKFGDYVTLKCNVEPYNPNTVYTWTKDGRYASSSKEYRIESFSQADIGFYHCKGSIDGVPVTSNGASVKPEQASLTIIPYPIYVRPRNTFEFKCVSNDPKQHPELYTQSHELLSSDPRFSVRYEGNTVTAVSTQGLSEEDLNMIIYCKSFNARDETIIFNQQTPCQSHEGMCRSGQCVQRTSFCNGQLDCTDGSDEEDYYCSNNQIVITPSKLNVRPRTRFIFTCSVPMGQSAVVTNANNIPLNEDSKFRLRTINSHTVEVEAIEGLQEIDKYFIVKCQSLQTGKEKQMTIDIDSKCTHQACRCHDATCHSNEFCDEMAGCDNSSAGEIKIWPSRVDYRQGMRFNVTCKTNSNKVPKLRQGSTKVPIQQLPYFSVVYQSNNKITAILEQDIDVAKLPLNIECYLDDSSEVVISSIYHSNPCNPGSELSCRNGQCLSLNKFCDGARDCLDGSDEDMCKPIWSPKEVAIVPKRRISVECESPKGVRHAPKIRNSRTGQDLTQDPRFKINYQDNRIIAVAEDGVDESLTLECYMEKSPSFTVLIIHVIPSQCPFETCDNGKVCLQRSMICDGQSQCVDQRDEQQCKPIWSREVTNTPPDRKFTIECESNPASQFLPKLRDADTKYDLEYDSRFRVEKFGNKIRAVAINGIPSSMVIDCYTSGLYETTLYITVDKTECLAPNHLCDGRRVCINKSQLCDGRQDCRDGSDESNCKVKLAFDQKEIRARKHEETKITCRSSGTMIPRLRYPDTMMPLDSDNEWTITRSGPGIVEAIYNDIVPIRWQKIECFYPTAISDYAMVEVQCPYNEKACADYTQCIPNSYWCDGQQHCRDGSDEIACYNGGPGGKQLIKEVDMVVNQTDRINLKCIATGGGKVTLRYHGTNESLDARDYFKVERISPSQTNAFNVRDLPVGNPAITTECLTENFITLTRITVLHKCNIGFSKCRDKQMCIPNAKLCDSVQDCPSGSDEEGCPTTVKFIERNIEIPPEGRFVAECVSTGSQPYFRMLPFGELPSEFRVIRVTDKITRLEGTTSKSYIIECTNKENNTDTLVIRVSNDCPTTQFRCRNGSCIDKKKICDGVNDCKDDSDEDGVTCLNDPTGKFEALIIYTTTRNETSISCGTVKPGTHFKERHTNQVIGQYPHFSYKIKTNNFAEIYNDGVLPVGTIELDCVDVDGKVFQIFKIIVQCERNEKLCQSGDECYAPAKFCDGISDCRDGSDEKNCPVIKEIETVNVSPKDLITQPDKKFSVECIYRSSSGSPLFRTIDPSLQSYAKISNPDQQTIRMTFERGLPRSYREVYLECTLPSGIKDTSKVTIRQECPPNHLPCRNGDCIHATKFCDGHKDCRDESDEVKANCQNTCQPLTQTCGQSDDTFQVSWKCDAENDCNNSFDEDNCSNYERIPGENCGGTHFKCTNAKKIPFWYQCDSNDDCGDGSDESNCVPPTILSTVPAKEIKARKGETVRLECNVLGKPLPIVIWRYNWGCLTDEYRAVSTVHSSNSDCRGSKSILTISNLRESDAGLYNCEAVTSNNRALSQEIQLFVI